MPSQTAISVPLSFINKIQKGYELCVSRDARSQTRGAGSLFLCKAEHLYSALHGIQTTFKRSGMDHTVYPARNTMPAFTL